MKKNVWRKSLERESYSVSLSNRGSFRAPFTVFTGLRNGMVSHTCHIYHSLQTTHAIWSTWTCDSVPLELQDDDMLAPLHLCLNDLKATWDKSWSNTSRAHLMEHFNRLNLSAAEAGARYRRHIISRENVAFPVFLPDLFNLNLHFFFKAFFLREVPVDKFIRCRLPCGTITAELGGCTTTSMETFFTHMFEKIPG